MITIQGFAKLCGCNTQTLRYYDRIGLLAPAKVDEWTGYRYYEEQQAMLFVKIKNLQQADFSIDEIRPLLAEDGERLQEACERKIREQEQKLDHDIALIREGYTAGNWIATPSKDACQLCRERSVCRRRFNLQ